MFFWKDPVMCKCGYVPGAFDPQPGSINSCRCEANAKAKEKKDESRIKHLENRVEQLEGDIKLLISFAVNGKLNHEKMAKLILSHEKNNG